MVKKNPHRTKHIPQRTCVGCHEVLAKRSLIRVVRTATGIKIDQTGKLSGRGAYIHDQAACWQAAMKGKLEKALRSEFTEQDRKMLSDFMTHLPSPNQEIDHAVEG